MSDYDLWDDLELKDRETNETKIHVDEVPYGPYQSPGIYCKVCGYNPWQESNCQGFAGRWISEMTECPYVRSEPS